MQWNARSAASNKNSLCKFLSENNIGIALISETWFKPNTIINIYGYHIIRNDRVDGKGGVAILIKNTLPFNELIVTHNFNREIEVCAANVSIDGQKITFLSIYKPPNVKTNINDWDRLFSQFPTPVVIGGDFNAHHGLWGAAKKDASGDQLVEIIDKLNLINLNNGLDTRISRPG